MNFLELARDLRRESGAGGDDNAPSGVTGQLGEPQRLVQWVVKAWNEIQQHRADWLWMRSDFTFNTVAGTAAYLSSAMTDSVAGAPITRFSDWRRDTLRSYLAATGVADEQYLVEWAYEDFRDIYEFGVHAHGRPTIFAVRDRDMAIVLGDTPNAAYTVRGQYQKSPQTLAAATDIPEMPNQFHSAIVYKAMQFYAAYEAAPEVMARGITGYNDMLRRIVRKQAPRPPETEPIA